VGKWRARFVHERLDGLYDEPRPGAPRVTDDQVEQVMVRTLEAMPRGATHWSTRGMAKASGFGRTTVHQIWRAFGLQPHRTETFKLSTDPELVREAAALSCPFHADLRLVAQSGRTLVCRAGQQTAPAGGSP
jgi:hypothetical protein